MILKTILINKFTISIIFIFSFLIFNAQTVDQYYIKIVPNIPTVDCGKLNVKNSKTKLKSFFGKEIADYIKPELALQTINDSILKKNKDVKVVFFIHGFWASLPFAVHRNAKGFKQKYFKQDSEKPIAIVHIHWDANDVLYKHTLENLDNSTKVLAEIFINISKSISFKTSLLCHSMGNRYLYQTLLNEKPKVQFENLLLVAADLDYRKFESNANLFTSIAKTVDIFYNEKDKTLNMSRGINRIERLGRVNKTEIEEKINFIDCTEIDDINNLYDSVMKHLYFITSDTVISKIEQILISNNVL